MTKLVNRRCEEALASPKLTYEILIFSTLFERVQVKVETVKDVAVLCELRQELTRPGRSYIFTWDSERLWSPVQRYADRDTY